MHDRTGRAYGFQNVSDLLGHAWSKTTLVYAGSSSRRASRAYGAHVVQQREALKFFRCPVGGEMCGPFFTPDTISLFLAVQHPAEDGEKWPEFDRPSTFNDPSARWPDFQDGMPPRPAIVVITKQDGGRSRPDVASSRTGDEPVRPSVFPTAPKSVDPFAGRSRPLPPARESASSMSTLSYRTVLSIFVWPSRI